MVIKILNFVLHNGFFYKIIIIFKLNQSVKYKLIKWINGNLITRLSIEYLFNQSMNIKNG